MSYLLVLLRAERETRGEFLLTFREKPEYDYQFPYEFTLLAA